MYAARGHNVYGVGSYFGTDLSLVDRYACQVYSAVDKQVCQAVFMAKVLVGEYVQGSKDMCKSMVFPKIIICWMARILYDHVGFVVFYCFQTPLH